MEKKEQTIDLEQLKADVGEEVYADVVARHGLPTLGKSTYVKVRNAMKDLHKRVDQVERAQKYRDDNEGPSTKKADNIEEINAKRKFNYDYNVKRLEYLAVKEQQSLYIYQGKPAKAAALEPVEEDLKQQSEDMRLKYAQDFPDASGSKTILERHARKLEKEAMRAQKAAEKEAQKKKKKAFIDLSVLDMDELKAVVEDQDLEIEWVPGITVEEAREKVKEAMS